MCLLLASLTAPVSTGINGPGPYGSRFPWIFSCGDIQRPPAPSDQHFAQSRFAPRVTHLAVGSDVPLGLCCTQGFCCWYGERQRSSSCLGKTLIEVGEGVSDHLECALIWSISSGSGGMAAAVEELIVGREWTI
jgi:hypothetical protein